MNYKNEKHRELFGEAVRRKDKKDYELMSALYLLTSDLRLWQKVKRYTEKSIIDFEHIRVISKKTSSYTKPKPRNMPRLSLRPLSSQVWTRRASVRMRTSMTPPRAY